MYSEASPDTCPIDGFLIYNMLKKWNPSTMYAYYISLKSHCITKFPNIWCRNSLYWTSFDQTFTSVQDKDRSQKHSTLHVQEKILIVLSLMKDVEWILKYARFRYTIQEDIYENKVDLVI